MDDRLQRRLRDADPLTAADGLTPDPARLDAIKEQIMQTEAGPARSSFRPRAIGVTALMAGSLALVLVVGTLIRPTATTLAWEPGATPVTDADKAAAEKACTSNAQPLGVSGVMVTTASAAVGSGQGIGLVAGSPETGTVVSGSGTMSGSGTISGPVSAEGGLSVAGSIPPGMPELPPMPSALPPLVSLELHGNGGVAILADDTTTAYCLLKRQGGGFISGGLMVSVGPAAPADAFFVSGMATTFADQTLGIITGAAPARATTVRVVGGSADGAVATVDHGRFALWIPGALLGEDVTLVAQDANGAEVARQMLSKVQAPPLPPPATPAPSTAP
jgi:hypothetical protein